MRYLVTPALALLCAALWLSPGVVAAQDATTDEARLAFTRGSAAYEAGRYDEALSAFQHAYELTHAPELLYNIGSVAERLRRDELAIESYEGYLRATPGASDRAAVEARLRILREASAEARDDEEIQRREVEEAERLARDDERQRAEGGDVDAPSAAAAASPYLYGPARLDEASVTHAIPDLAIDASLELGVFADNVRFAPMTAGAAGFDVAIVSFSAAASARLRYGPIGVELDVPLEVFSGDPADPNLSTQVTLGMGNLNLAAFGVGDLTVGSAEITLRGGLGIALPTAYYRPFDGGRCLANLGRCVNDEYLPSLASVYGYYTAAAQAGEWQRYRYSFDHWAFFVPFGAEATIDRLGFVAVDGLFSVHVNDDYQDTVDLALAVEGGVNALPFLRLSVRMLGYGVMLQPATDDRAGGSVARFLPGDDFQLSMEPRVTLAVGAFFARASVLVNLDEPWGVGGGTSDNASGVWAARVTLGARF